MITKRCPIKSIGHLRFYAIDLLVWRPGDVDRAGVTVLFNRVELPAGRIGTAFTVCEGVGCLVLVRNADRHPGEQTVLADPDIANPGTVNSAVFAPAELTMWVAAKGPRAVSQGEFIKFCLWDK